MENSLLPSQRCFKVTFLYLYVDKESESALGKYSITNIKYSPWPKKNVKSKEMLENLLQPSHWCLSLSLCRMIRNQNTLLDIIYILWIDATSFTQFWQFFFVCVQILSRCEPQKIVKLTQMLENSLLPPQQSLLDKYSILIWQVQFTVFAKLENPRRIPLPSASPTKFWKIKYKIF